MQREDLGKFVKDLPYKEIREKFRGHPQGIAFADEQGIHYHGFGYSFSLEGKGSGSLVAKMILPNGVFTEMLPTPDRVAEIFGIPRDVEVELGLTSAKTNRHMEYISKGEIELSEDSSGLPITSPVIVKHSIKDRVNYDPTEFFEAVHSMSVKPFVKIVQDYIRAN